MARVGVIVVSYRTDPEPLFTSIGPSRHQVRWYIFVHGDDPQLRSKLDAFVQTVDARYFPYGVNRGLARSWNEGIIASYGDGNDVTIILNDDLFFYEDGFDRFVDFVLEQQTYMPNFGIVMTYGMEPASHEEVGMPENKKVLTVGACFAIGQAAIERVGYFDENFWPAYLEDFDYSYRLGLADLPILSNEEALLEHQRSATVRNDRLISLLNPERLRRNEYYYNRKWGGFPDQETFIIPFNRKNLNFFIDKDQRHAPFGENIDRSDLGLASSIGVLENSFPEELMATLRKHDGSIRACLEWGTGAATPIMAEFARERGAEFFLSITHLDEHFCSIVDDVPKYSFVHFRVTPLKNLKETEIGTDLNCDYISYPLLLGRKFDIITVAGELRMDCTLLAWTALEPGGLVILHDEEAARHRLLRRKIGRGLRCLDRWEDARRNALLEVYDVVEERRQFVVLRSKRGGETRTDEAEY